MATQWLTVTDICETLGVARSTWNKWLATGRAPKVKKLPNGQLRVRSDEFEAWMDGLPEVAA